MTDNQKTSLAVEIYNEPTDFHVPDFLNAINQVVAYFEQHDKCTEEEIYEALEMYTKRYGRCL